MKNIFFLFSFFLLTNYCNAQTNSIVKITGKIQNPISDTVEVSYNDNRIAYYPKLFYGLVGKTGSFTITLPVPKGVFIQAELKHANHVADLIVQQGDSFMLTLNTNNFDSSIHYRGKGSDIQNFIAYHTFKKGRMNQYASKLKESIKSEPEEFIKTIEDARKDEMNFLNLNKKNLPIAFVKYWAAYYEYYNYFFIQQYPQVHEMMKLRRFTDTIPEINYSVVKKMPLSFNDTFLQLPPYLLYLTGVFEIKLRAAGYSFYVMDSAKSRLFRDTVFKLVYKEMPDKSAEYYMAQNLYGRTRYQTIELTRSLFAEFKSHWSSSEYIPLLSKQLAMAEKLAPGQPVPDIGINTIDGKKIKLSALKGKVVYLHFWAGWCRQCVGEMIKEQKIKDLLTNKPIEFVYVSLGTDVESEKEILKKYKIDGTFCNIAGAWNAKEVQDYWVQSLPAYFLIDEDGKFALQNPPTPMQSTQLVLEIEKLFK